MNGFSGDKLEIKNNKVYKYSNNFKRLYNQVSLYRQFALSDLSPMPSDLIKNNNQYYFSYKYINGINLLEYIKINSIGKTIKKIEKVLDLMQKMHKLGLIHGDLCFDNIIVSNSKIYFIDMIKNHFEHRWFDYAKLYQCLDEIDWAKIRYKINIDTVKLKLIKEYINNRINKIDPKYRKYHYTMQIYILNRILAKSREIKNKEVEKKILEKIYKITAKI